MSARDTASWKTRCATMQSPASVLPQPAKVADPVRDLVQLAMQPPTGLPLPPGFGDQFPHGDELSGDELPQRRHRHGRAATAREQRLEGKFSSNHSSRSGHGQVPAEKLRGGSKSCIGGTNRLKAEDFISSQSTRSGGTTRLLADNFASGHSMRSQCERLQAEFPSNHTGTNGACGISEQPAGRAGNIGMPFPATRFDPPGHSEAQSSLAQHQDEGMGGSSATASLLEMYEEFSKAPPPMHPLIQEKAEQILGNHGVHEGDVGVQADSYVMPEGGSYYSVGEAHVQQWQHVSQEHEPMRPSIQQKFQPAPYGHPEDDWQAKAHVRELWQEFSREQEQEPMHPLIQQKIRIMMLVRSL